MAHSDLWKDLGREFRAVDPERRIRIQWEPIGGRPHWSVMGVGRGGPSNLIQFSVLAKRAGTILNPDAPSPLENVWFDALRHRFPYTEEGANEGCILYVSEKSAELCDVMEYNALEFERSEQIAIRQGAPPAAQHTTSLRPKRIRQTGTTTSMVAASRAHDYMQKRAWTQVQFGNKAGGISDKTLRSFFKTGTIRKGLLSDIAKAMKTDIETLLEP
jgi:hypothetical protein